MPLISVIVPVYKVEPYLRRCVDSILAQTFTDFELILVDDGSPDNCGAICDEYAQKDSRVHVIHQANGGLSAARNAGIDWVFAGSNSKWISFVDSDDWVHPMYLKWLYQACIKCNTDISICGYESTSVERIDSLVCFKERIFSPEELWVKQYGEAVIACGKLWKKDLFSERRFPIGKLAEDLFITPLILFSQMQIAFIPEKLYYYYQSASSIMRGTWTPKKLTMIEAHEKQLAFFRKNGYMDAYGCQKKHYCLTLASQVSDLEKRSSFEGKKDYLHQLRKKLKESMGRCWCKTIRFTEETAWVYDAAYPQIMKVYWHCKALQERVKRYRRG